MCCKLDHEDWIVGEGKSEEVRKVDGNDDVGKMAIGFTLVGPDYNDPAYLAGEGDWQWETLNNNNN